MIVLDKFRGGRELVPGRELIHHHYNFYGICVLCKSLVLCGVVPRLYTQVSRAEVTTSKSVDK